MGKKVCSNCGLELQNGQLFCKKCGTKVASESKLNKDKTGSLNEKICKKCHNVLKSNEVFCAKCGSKFLEDKNVSNVESVEHKNKEDEKKDNKTEFKEKKCSKCGHVLKDKELFCSHCGAKYEASELSFNINEKNYILPVEIKKELNTESDKDIKNIVKEDLAKEGTATILEKENISLEKASQSEKFSSLDQKKKHCPKCGREVGKKDLKCVNCGAQLKEKNRWPLIIIILFLVILLISYLVLAYQNYCFPFNKDTVESNSQEIMFSMPNLVGKTLKEAEIELEKVGLDSIVEYLETDDESLIGKVFEQSIEENAKVRKGDVVTLKVYDLSGNLKMISVVGMTKAEAKTKLENMGLVVVIQEDYSDFVGKDLVISQDKAENEKISEGETITLVVSLGKKSTSVNGNQSGNSQTGNSSTSNQNSSNNNQNQTSSSNTQNQNNSVNKNWSNWVSSLPSNVNSNNYTIESKTEYRQRIKSTTTSTTSSVMNGWTFVRKEESVARETTYSATYSYYESYIKNNPKYEVISIVKNGTAEVQTAHCDKTDGTASISLNSNLSCPSGYNKHNGPTHANLSGNNQVGAEFNNNYVCPVTGKSVSNIIISRVERYDIRLKVTETVYYFERWSDWSSWTTSYIAKTSLNEVQTRVLYRYKLK